jgi:hypothetical protein
LKIALAKVLMLNKIVFPAIGCLALGLILLTFRPGQAQQESTRYFPETGHFVDEPFLSPFQAQGGVQIFGPPITEAFADNGRLVQYFDSARWECMGSGDAPCEARLSPLGELLGHQTPRVPPVPDSMIRDGLCRYFPETGHNVCFSFLTFYEENGGLEVLGPPISELTVQSGVIAQYFRQARIEWQMYAPASAAMQLGSLGREHFVASGLDPSLLTPVESAGVSATTVERIAVGARVTVVNTEGAGLRLRSGPGTNQPAIETLQEGEILVVVEGPQSGDGFTWWRVEHNGTTGWCASEWLEPVEAPVSP